MKKRIISLTGDLAAGKSRVTDLLQKELGYSIYRNGERFRALALEMGMSVTEFNKYVETHPEIDKKLESEATKYAETNQDFIIDARMGWYSVPESFKVYLKVDRDVGAQRAFGDEKRKRTENFNTVEEYKNDMIKRANLEVERYFNLYGVRKDDMSNYDLVVDTTCLTIEEVKQTILDEYDKWLKEEQKDVKEK